MRWLPQSIFWRLFIATASVVGITLLVIVLLVVHERRELVFNESGSAAAAANIVEAATRLAHLPPAARVEVMEELRNEPLTFERRRMRRLPDRADSIAAERQFARHVQRQLGRHYKVAAGPSIAPEERTVLLLSERTARMLDASPERGPPSRTFDVNVTLPDGEQIAFRTPAMRGGPPLPRTLFIELAALTLVLGIVLFAMTRTITRPLKELAQAADAVGRGTQTPPLQERGAREIRRATRAFNAMQERLKRYLDSRTRVLAAMSHDLRTPLTRLRLRVESIEDDTLRERCVEDLDEMSRMVSGALSLFRGLNDEEQASATDVNALLEALQRQYSEMGQHVSITGRAHGPIKAKPLALKRCLTNLIDNAVQYGTRATLEVEDGAQLTIRVLDDGPGIPTDSLDQVFEPFFRLEASRNRATGGTGLGLSIARDIAQAHGGTLTLDNRAEGGLAAVLTLPRKTEELSGRSD